MDNDNEISSAPSKEAIHQQVLMFLGEELSQIHQNTESQSYDIETEYEKTKNHYSFFSMILLCAALLVVVATAFIMTRVISNRNQEIAVSLNEFEDLNLKNLLNSASSALSNYENAEKNVERTKSDYASELNMAAEGRDNRIFVLTSMHLEDEADFKARLKVINEDYEEEVKAIHDEYREKIEKAEEEAALFKNNLDKYDLSTIENVQNNNMDSESQLHKLELKSLENRYEKRIADLEASMRQQREQSKADMRDSINQVVEKYQAEIDRLDPKLRGKDVKGYIIIDEDVNNKNPDFNGNETLAQNEISEETFVDAVSDYQEKYDQYVYLNNKVAEIPQKNSIPEYIATSRNLVNEMSESYLNTTIKYYEEKAALNAEIERKDAEYTQALKNQQKLYENSMTNMLVSLKASALLLSASDYDDIKIFIAPQARYLVAEEGAEAEFKAEKTTIKGSVIQDGEDEYTAAPKYRFVVAEDKEGNLPEIDFSLITPGITVKILSK